MNQALLKIRKNYWILIIFALFLIANFSFVWSVPGLMGDEGSEGQNVYELLNFKQITIMGERSYIGVLVDYLRVPFVLVFSYNALAIRLPILLFSIAFFWLAFFTIKKTFGLIPAIFALIFLTFSPVYLGEQRLAWAITLLPFFAILSVFFLQKQGKWNYLLAGLALGLGLSTHILFLPTLVSIVIIFLISLSFRGKNNLIHFLKNSWTGLVSFWAGFATQFAILQLFKDDQGNPEKVAELFSERFQALPSLLPTLLTGSVYIARYTGELLSQNINLFILCALTLLVVLGLFFIKPKKYYFLILLGGLIHLIVLLFLIDRYSIRYFAVFTISFWGLAGLSLGFIVQKLTISDQIKKISAVVLAVILILFSANKILFPFLKTGGSTNVFSLGNREESADALVGLSPLLSCIADKKVASDDIQIRNRLIYLENSDKRINLVDPAKADFVIKYRRDSTENPKEICPELSNFKVIKK